MTYPQDPALVSGAASELRDGAPQRNDCVLHRVSGRTPARISWDLLRLACWGPAGRCNGPSGLGPLSWGPLSLELTLSEWRHCVKGYEVEAHPQHMVVPHPATGWSAAPALSRRKVGTMHLPLRLAHMGDAVQDLDPRRLSTLARCPSQHPAASWQDARLRAQPVPNFELAGQDPSCACQGQCGARQRQRPEVAREGNG